jgi:multiple sugar transport system ATP-binding protein
LAIGAGGDGPALSGEVAFVEDLGATLLVHFDIDAARPKVGGAEDEALEIAEPSRHARIKTMVDGFAALRAGDRVDAALDLDRVHLFDPRTGASIGARAG